MKRIVIVNQGQPQLCQALLNQVPQATVKDDFTWAPATGDIICWLPGDKQRVDLEVAELVRQLDQNRVQPAKIVMKSVAGTADDASMDQLSDWYGEEARNLVMDHLYAIKMIDELEFPYTIVRSLPLTNESVDRHPLAEGEPFSGQQSNVDAVAQLLADAVELKKFQNQSIGI